MNPLIRPNEMIIAARTVIVKAECPRPDCTGYLIATNGYEKASWPPQIPHKCDVCGEEVYVSGQRYPLTRHEEAE